MKTILNTLRICKGTRSVNNTNFFAHLAECTRNEDCSLTEACVDKKCQRPCNLHNPCAINAVCINTNHGFDCSCNEGYHGNGYVLCEPGKRQNNRNFYKQILNYSFCLI